MKTTKLFIAAGILPALMTLSCTKEGPAADQPAQGGKVIHMTVQADMLGTKATIEEGKYVWEASDKVGVLIGNNNHQCAGYTQENRGTADYPDTTYPMQCLDQDTSNPGIFSGDIVIDDDITDLSVDDIRGVVYPYDNSTSWVKKHSNGLRIITSILPEQVQKTNGCLNGHYFPSMLKCSKDDLTLVDGSYVLSGKSFRAAFSAIAFNIYGTNPNMSADEVFKSISMTVDGGTATSGAVELYVNVTKPDMVSNPDAYVFNKNSTTTKVSLTEACTLNSRTAADGIKVYMALLPRGGEMTVGSVTIETDMGKYTKNIGKPISLQEGFFNRVDLNISDMEVINEVNYSVDNGATWSTDFPTESFSSLAVKGNIDQSVLTAIHTATVANQVDFVLDLSKAKYSSTEFPKVFGDNSNVANANQYLKEIKFPVNTTSIAAYAFYGTGVSRVNVPSTITSMGKAIFRMCYELESVYYDSPHTPISDQEFTFAFSNAELKSSFTRHTVAEVTVGPNVTTVPNAFIRSNLNVETLTIVGNPNFMKNALRNCYYLRTIICRSNTPPTCAADPTYTDLAKNVPVDQRKVIVPKGCKEAYEAVSFWQLLRDTFNFTIEEVEEDE